MFDDVKPQFTDREEIIAMRILTRQPSAVYNVNNTKMMKVFSLLLIHGYLMEPEYVIQTKNSCILAKKTEKSVIIVL